MIAPCVGISGCVARGSDVDAVCFAEGVEATGSALAGGIEFPITTVAVALGEDHGALGREDLPEIEAHDLSTGVV